MIYIGIHGCVLALDRATGEEIWRTKLRGDFVNVVLQDGALYAASGGEMFCLDPSSGHIRWNNRLKGLGLGLITIATVDDQQSIVLHQKRQQDEAAAATSAAT
ncbi:MAG TPA: PQQ-binding-like beta-propeller repeat protein [Bryobacteraceae bacterium]|nr:PQQ-binding-like beta-propeller repeat protein [Bryobacteraceae bacterium]